MTDHPYNAPNIGPHAFLLACMHDPALDLHMRVTAADYLCRLGFGHVAEISTLKVTIEGGFPDPNAEPPKPPLYKPPDPLTPNLIDIAFARSKANGIKRAAKAKADKYFQDQEHA